VDVLGIGETFARTTSVDEVARRHVGGSPRCFEHAWGCAIVVHNARITRSPVGSVGRMIGMPRRHASACRACLLATHARADPRNALRSRDRKLSSRPRLQGLFHGELPGSTDRRLSSRPAVTIGVMPVAFSLLRESYPVDRSPCGDGWDNQCAIRM